MTSAQQLSAATSTTQRAATATASAQLAGNVNGSWKKANSTRDTDSLAPLVEGSEEATPDTPRRKSWLKRLSHHDKDGDKNVVKEKKKSISDSGPFIFVYDPKTGKEILRKNPHWPNEDSWKREKEVEGQWAFGSMMGQQGVESN